MRWFDLVYCLISCRLPSSLIFPLCVPLRDDSCRYVTSQENVDTDWPLYVRGHDGVARNLFIEVSRQFLSVLVCAFSNYLCRPGAALDDA